MSTTDPLTTWPQFMEAVRLRMEQGRETYGDASFARPPTELAAEIEQELLDVCGWAFILWVRITRLRQAIEEHNVQS